MTTLNHVSQAHGSAEREVHGEDEVGGGNEGRGQDDLEGGRGENNPRQLVVYPSNPRLREMSIIVFAQTTAVIIALQFRGDRSSILIAVVLCNIADYICCSSATVLRSWRPGIDCILGRIGSLAAELGFILMIAMFLPNYLLWIIPLTCLYLSLIFVSKTFIIRCIELRSNNHW